MLNHFVTWITSTVQQLGVAGYWIAFLAAMSETVLGLGLLLPGSTIILLLGAFAARGYLDLGDLILFAFAGAVIGDNINYFLGRKYGARWVEDGFWFIKREHFDKARIFFDRHGAVSVLWGRLIPSVKEVVPFIAGLVKMHRGVFFFWNVLGAVCWAFEWVLVGYFFGHSLTLAKAWMSRFGFAAALIALLFVLLALVRRAIVRHGSLVIDVAQSLAHSVGQAVAGNPKVVKLVSRHEKFFSFLRRRLARDHFTGMPLTLLSTAFLYLLALFGGVVEDLITGDPIVAADMHISSLVAVFRSPALVHFFLWVTMLGKWQVVLIFSFTLLAVLYLLREKPLIPSFLAVLLGSTTFTWLGKIAFHRPRPELAVYIEPSFSFPSGHSVIAVSLYGFIAFVLVRRTKVWKRKVNYVMAAFVLALLIGFSRIYLGVHYLSDVWGGFLLGSLWLVIGITLSFYFKLTMDDVHGEPLPHSRLAVPALAAMAVVSWIGISAVSLPVVQLPSPPPESARVVTTPAGIFTDGRSRFTESITGVKQQPINVILIAGNDQMLVQDLASAGWHSTESLTPLSFFRSVIALIKKRDYPSAPVTPGFWGVKVNDLSFRHSAAPDQKGIVHVLRLWKTSMSWKDGKAVYIGQVSRGRSLAHPSMRHINLDVDSEREFLSRSLVAAAIAMPPESIQMVSSTTGSNTLGDLFVTDGRAVFMVLTGSPPPKGGSRADPGTSKAAGRKSGDN
jgi:undecaprenyl-diphosphatase